VALNVAKDFFKAKLELRDQISLISSESVSLTPLTTYRMQFPGLPAATTYTVTLVDGSGTPVLRHTEGKYDYVPKADVLKELPSAYVYPVIEQRTESDFLELGMEQERNGKALEAVSTYRDGLKYFAGSVPLYRAAGRLEVALKQYSSAIQHLTLVMTRISNDMEASYYLGLAYSAIGEAQKARRAFEVGAQFGTFRPSALFELAALDAREGDLGRAREKLVLAYTEFPDASRASGMDVSLLRALGHPDKARKTPGKTAWE